jgi:hypothetical protein
MVAGADLRLCGPYVAAHLRIREVGASACAFTIFKNTKQKSR